MSETQLSMFSEYPDRDLGTPVHVGDVGVPRPRGWSLLATTRGVRGWHRVQAHAELGTVVSVCGLTARVVPDDARIIVPCPFCEAGTDADA